MIGEKYVSVVLRVCNDLSGSFGVQVHTRIRLQLHILSCRSLGNTPAIQKGMGTANNGGQSDPLHPPATSLIAAAVAVCLCVCCQRVMCACAQIL